MSAFIPVIVVLVLALALGIWMDMKGRRVRNLPSSGDEQARRSQAESQRRAGRWRAKP